ncbi:MAG: alpha/beta hydrolase [Bacteroidota bacterium]|nr:alpha/beta hydrolase [Bacteroidota bacterium]
MIIPDWNIPPKAGGTFRLSRGKTWIGYTARGKGPPCIICPVPWGVSSHQWNTLLAMSDFLTLIFVDPRGTGISGPVFDKQEYGIPTLVDDLEAVRNALGISSWLVMGQSAGGFTALEYALAFPQAAEKLMVICSSPTGFFHKGTIRDKNHPRYPEVKENAEKFRREFTAENFRAYMRSVYVMDVQREGAKAEVDAMFASTDISIERYKYFATVELSRYNVLAKLPAIACPTLIIAGKHDIHVSPSHSETMRERIPNARYVLMERSGHFPWLDEPEKFTEVAKNFILGGETK